MSKQIRKAIITLVRLRSRFLKKALRLVVYVIENKEVTVS